MRKGRLGCACSGTNRAEERLFVSYEFGTDKCSETDRKSGVHEYLIIHADDLTKISKCLKNVAMNDKSSEIKTQRNFLSRFG